MDALPLELLAQIFEFACTDDGSTARALSLVSRSVRDVSAPYRFQSLVIMGSEQMEELASRLDVTPQGRRRVRHVFLSDRTCAQWEDRALRTRGEEELDRYEAERALALRVLALVAPTVETLAVEVSCILNSTALLGALFSMTMPRLTELSVYGFYPFPHTPRTMPRLERLHLSGNPNPDGLFQLGALDAACPSLKDIRISGLVGAVGTAAVLLDALFRTGRPPVPDQPFLPTALPPLLRRITLEGGKLSDILPKKESRSRSLDVLYDATVARFRELHNRTDLPVQVSVVEKGLSNDYDTHHLLKSEWLDRLTKTDVL